MTMRTVFRAVDIATNTIIYVLLSAMIVNTAVSVFFRYVLGNAISWSEEASRYLMIWMGFFGMALATKSRSHVSITFVTSALPPLFRKILRYVADLIIIAFIVLLFVLSIRQIIGSEGETTAALLLPMTVPYLSITVGSFLMFVQAVRRFILLVRGIDTESHIGEEIEQASFESPEENDDH